MTFPSGTYATFDDAPDSSRPTVRYPSTSDSGYEGLDAHMIERSDSVFPPSVDPEPDAWVDPLPLVSTAQWLRVLIG